MKKYIYKILLLTCLGFLIQSTNLSFAQQTTGLGAFAGGGSFKGNFPSEGCFTSSVFFDFAAPFMGGLTSRLSFVYATGTNVLLAKTNNTYNPFIRGFSLKELITKNISNNFYFEGGLGPLVLNDRSFTSINVWDAGFAFSALAGIDFSNGNTPGVSAGFGTEYGLTFTKTSVQYFAVYLQAKYSF
jgi:hypothetical protein